MPLPDTQLQQAEKKLSTPEGTAAAEKTGGNPTPKTKSTLDAARAKNDMTQAAQQLQTSGGQVVGTNPSVAQEKTGQQPAVVYPGPQPESVLPPVAPVQPPSAKVETMPAGEPQMIEAGKEIAKETPNAPAADPIAEASSKPGFWQQLLDVARGAGKTAFELLGDFAAGYSHQQSSPTEQRLAYEHELRMQGNQQQAQKDMANINAGFERQRQQVEQEFQAKLAQTTDARLREQMAIEHQDRLKSLDIERMQAQNQYMMNQLSLQWQQKTFGVNRPEMQHPASSFYGGGGK